MIEEFWVGKEWDMYDTERDGYVRCVRKYDTYKNCAEWYECPRWSGREWSIIKSISEKLENIYKNYTREKKLKNILNND